MKKKTRVLHVFGKMQRGGAELRTIEVMEKLGGEIGFDFCALSGESGVLDNKIKEMGGSTYYCKINYLFPYKFYKFLKKQKYDVVHSHVHYSSGLVVFIAGLAGINMRISHFRNTSDGQKKSLIRNLKIRIMKRWINKYSTNILAVSEGAMETAWHSNWKNDNRCKVIYNGINQQILGKETRELTYNELNISEDTKVLIHVGRMVKQKNHIKVVRIFNEYLKYNNNSVLLMVGRREETIENEIMNFARMNGIENKIIITGERDDVIRLLSVSNLLIFPSMWEGLPGVVLEALSVNTPVLASDLPGINEISSLLPNTTVMDINQSDIEWAKVLNRTLEKEIVNVNIDDTIFSINNNVSILKKLWNNEDY
ncbi:glycosyltransferase [Paenibacillus sp. FSL E2-0201]|uniref:glycosyltransferase n=1 Tax=Paenibacillus sp. FSL E2-0201 TaxID=2954726 RepID=UPI0030DC21DF